jgi:NAD-dependent DNA ligase
MDKIKPDTAVLDSWMKKYKGPYVLSCKLDGVSGLYSTEGPVPKLYTRGNGIVGQDVSYLIPYLTLPAKPNITIRGEFIIKKEVFIKKYADKFANPRNFVAGMINTKTLDLDKYKDLSFVIYEVIKPELKPSEQLDFLLKLKQPNLEIVQHIITKVISNEILSELLIKWRNEYKYEIDGIICIQDSIFPRTNGNPEHAFAFKMVISDQIAEPKVVEVIWTPSKDGYLKPRVQIEPITLGGVQIEYATGFNAKFIIENNIGIGAIIRLIRSGDVIPHILSVVQPATQPQLPSKTLYDYEWNDTHVDFVLKDKTSNEIVIEKNITGFFQGIEVEGLSTGNVKKLINAGFDTLPKIVAMTIDDFLKVEGFQKKLATKIKDGIEKKLESSTIGELMSASNIFGRGFGTKKLELILTTFPNILKNKEYLIISAEQMDKDVPGLAIKTALQFKEKIPEFIEFMKSIGLERKLEIEESSKKTKKDKSPNTMKKIKENPLFGKKWIMTGFRDKVLIEKLDDIGAEQGSVVNKNIFVVIVKDLTDENTKTQTAKKLGIPIMTPEQLTAKYF